jgi:T5SS/PEP-CTERM-associated repeat protein
MRHSVQTLDSEFSFRPLAVATAELWSAARHCIRRAPQMRHLCIFGVAIAASFAGGTAAAQLVTSSGDVSPSFAEAASVNLAGQRVFVGFTNGSVGTQGALSVTGGGSLTAAQIVPGIGGLGVGTVAVNGAGSIINLTGGGAFNGLDIGSWGTGTMTVSNGAAVACSSPLACPYSSIANAAGSTGLLTINGGVLSGFGSFAVGTGTLDTGFGTASAPTLATLNIIGGGSLATTGSSVVGANNGQTGLVTANVTIDGAGSNWAITRDLANGGGQSFLSLATAANTNANVTISNGGKLSLTGSRSNPASDNSLPGILMSTAAGATSTMTVRTGGSLVMGGDTGIIIVGGESPNSTGAKATLNIESGGTVAGSGLNGLQFMAIGRNLGEGTVNVSGAGSRLTVAGVGGQNTQGNDGLGGLIIVGQNRNNGGGGIGTLNVNDGGAVLISDNGQVASTGAMGLRLAGGSGTSGTVNVSGAGSSLIVSSTAGIATTPEVRIGSGGVGKMTVSDGGAVFVQGSGQRSFIVGNSSTGSGTLDVNTGGQVSASWFAVGNNGGSGTATINNAKVNLDGVVIFQGSSLGAGARVGRGVGANGVLNLENGAALNINNSIADASVMLGGTSALTGGTGTLNMSGGSTISFTGAAASASLQVGGSSGGVGIMAMKSNSIVNVGATGRVIVGGVAGSSGSLDLRTGSRLLANNIDIGGSSDSAAGGTGSGLVNGPGSELKATGDSAFIGVGRGGSGALTVNQQGKLTGTLLHVGRSGGTGTLIADTATFDLSGQQTGGNQSGARFAVGIGGGIGTATLNNSAVNVTNLGSDGAAASVGGSVSFPSGSGTLNLAGASRMTVTAASGSQASVFVGHNGNGTLNASDGSSISVGSAVGNVFTANGSVYVGREVGSTGLLTLSGGSVINAGFVGVGVSAPGVGNALGAKGGIGRLELNNSTINTKRFELGEGSVLTGNNGIISAGVDGPVIIGGIVSPGNSPGRLRIKCDVTMLATSKLILEINDRDGGPGVDFDIDELIIGDDSKFDLTSLQIIFSFIGSTNPNEFAASEGGFSLDKFLLASGPDDEILGGLSTLFGNKRNPDTLNWGQAVNSKLFAFESSAYDVSEVSFDTETGQIDITASARVPEPASFALVLLALAAMGMTRRRQAALRR